MRADTLSQTVSSFSLIKSVKMWVNAMLPTLIVCLSHKFRSENETQSKKQIFLKIFMSLKH